jgi:hypothetical protein
MTDSDQAAPGHEPATCPWCAAIAAPEATTCAECGAALAQRESLGGVQIHGLTSVDPALADFDKRPLHIPGPSPTQGMAPAFIVGALAGGPAGLVAMGGVAALAGVEFAANQHDGTDERELADIGRPSEVALQALRHLNDSSDADATTPEAAAAPEPDAAAADGGMSVWRDLPPETDQAI